MGSAPACHAGGCGIIPRRLRSRRSCLSSLRGRNAGLKSPMVPFDSGGRHPELDDEAHAGVVEWQTRDAQNVVGTARGGSSPSAGITEGADARGRVVPQGSSVVERRPHKPCQPRVRAPPLRLQAARAAPPSPDGCHTRSCSSAGRAPAS
jgi:hypothetical protein